MPHPEPPHTVPWPPLLVICGLFVAALTAALLWTPDDWSGRAIVVGVFVAFFAALVMLGRRTQSGRYDKAGTKTDAG